MIKVLLYTIFSVRTFSIFWMKGCLRAEAPSGKRKVPNVSVLLHKFGPYSGQCMFS